MHAIQFLAPTSRQFPFDATVSAIVKALRLRNFDVPGITVSMSDYGSGEQRIRHVGRIEGDDFALHLHRRQGTLPGGRWSDAAACCIIVANRKALVVYEDESGPTLYVYVGDDWAADRERFMSGHPGVNSRLDGEPRRYLKYKGTTYRKRSPTLVHDHDMHREYDPRPGEPTEYVTTEIMAEMDAYLRDVVLAMIEAHPRADVLVDPCEPDPAIPWPSQIGPLFCFGDGRDRHRVLTGKQDPAQLQAHERYGLQPNDRLVWLDAPNDGTVPRVAYDGFIWCGLGDGSGDARVPGHRPSCFGGVHRFRVMPNRANDIYIADQAAYDRRRVELADEDKRLAAQRGEPVSSRFTAEQVADLMRARGRTLVPITEYRGGYEQPIVLVGRELDLEEVEIVSADA